MTSNKLKNDSLKVAIVCDWLTGIGGAERVVLELHNMFPHAPIYTSQYDPVAIDWFKNADVRTTWLQKIPVRLKKVLPVFRSWSFGHLDLTGYDLVISSSGAEAKAVKTNPDSMHILYCHSPTHYYWSRYEYYLTNPGFGPFDWLGSFGLKIMAKPLRKRDYEAAQKPRHIIANSTHTKAMIMKYYNRQSTVIHPPVDTTRFSKTPLDRSHRSGFVITGRQVPYKRIDLAVLACSRLGLPLTVLGDGPLHPKLMKLAGPSVTFITGASDQDVARHLSSAEAFLFPGLDDFGISPVEAMAAGTPVIAYRGGGALDYVTHGKTGLFFDEQTIDSLIGVLKKFPSYEFSHSTIQRRAQGFSTNKFHANMAKFIQSKLTE